MVMPPMTPWIGNKDCNSNIMRDGIACAQKAADNARDGAEIAGIVSQSVQSIAKAVIELFNKTFT